jgi:catechol 2,3-dioxygenase-like lactoylglutathione lyase family enzyme
LGLKHPFTAIDHVQLAMPDGCEDEASRFYCEILGMTELPKPAELATRGGCWFASGQVQVHLGIDPDFRPARKAHPALRCTDLGQILERLRVHGIPFSEDHSTQTPRAFVHDPFGNRLELL